MENTEKGNIRVYSILFFCLGALDLITLLVSFCSGQMNPEKFQAISNVSSSLITFSIAISVIISLLFIIIKVFIGLRGMNLWKGTGETKGLVPLLKVVLIIELLSLISLISSISQGNLQIIAICGSAVSVIAAFAFLKEIKKAKSAS